MSVAVPVAETARAATRIKSGTHLPALDGVRGLSILMVMAFHAGLPFVDGGFLGVDVFFVLSGFLITRLLLDEWQRTEILALRNFYGRRALRLLPALFVLLGTAWIAPSSIVGAEAGAAWKVVLIVFFYMANWHLARDVGSLGTLTHTWSLSIEEQFYLAWPLVLLFLLRRGIRERWLAGIVALGVVAVWLERVILFSVFDALQPRLYYGTDTRADGLLLGCLVGVLAASRMLPVGGWSLTWLRTCGGAALVSLLILGHCARIDTDVALGWSIPASLAAAVLLASVVTSPSAAVMRVLEQPVLVWIGRISYGLYLWHVPMFHGILASDRMGALGISGINLHLLRFAATFVVATVSFVLIERPLLRLKNRFREPAQAPRVASVGLATG